MSRPLRLEFAGALYHVTARDIFRDDGDRATFLDVLGREIAQQRWRLYADCLMGNHYHLLIETPEPNLTRGMQRLNQVYTQRFNRGQMWLGDEPFRAKMQRRLGAKRSADVSRAQREPARPNCLQKLPGHLIFRAMRCSTAATRRRIVVRFICCGGW